MTGREELEAPISAVLSEPITDDSLSTILDAVDQYASRHPGRPPVHWVLTPRAEAELAWWDQALATIFGSGQ